MRGHWGERFLFSIGVQLDALADVVVQGIGARFPEGPPPKSGLPRTPEALALIGRDRRIIRGFDEGDEAFIARLNRWLEDWPRAGSAYAVMDQVQGYLSGHSIKLRVINNTGGAWRTVNADGSKEYLRASPTNWDWSGEPAKVSRNWLIIYVPSTLWTEGPEVGDPELWGGAIGTPGYTIGSTATPNQLATLRAIIADFKGGHSKYEALVLAFDPASFDPTDAPGAPGMPDGTWGSQTNTGDPPDPARLSTARYIRGF